MQHHVRRGVCCRCSEELASDFRRPSRSAPRSVLSISRSTTTKANLRVTIDDIGEVCKCNDPHISRERATRKRGLHVYRVTNRQTMPQVKQILASWRQVQLGHPLLQSGAERFNTGNGEKLRNSQAVFLADCAWLLFRFSPFPVSNPRDPPCILSVCLIL